MVLTAGVSHTHAQTRIKLFNTGVTKGWHWHHATAQHTTPHTRVDTAACTGRPDMSGGWSTMHRGGLHPVDPKKCTPLHQIERVPWLTSESTTASVGYAPRMQSQAATASALSLVRRLSSTQALLQGYQDATDPPTHDTHTACPIGQQSVGIAFCSSGNHV